MLLPRLHKESRFSPPTLLALDEIRTAGAYVDHRIIKTLIDAKLTAGNERGLRHLNPVSIQYSPCNVHKFVLSRYAWLYFFYNLSLKHVNNGDFALAAVCSNCSKNTGCYCRLHPSRHTTLKQRCSPTLNQRCIRVVFESCDNVVIFNVETTL